MSAIIRVAADFLNKRVALNGLLFCHFAVLNGLHRAEQARCALLFCFCLLLIAKGFAAKQTRFFPAVQRWKKSLFLRGVLMLDATKSASAKPRNEEKKLEILRWLACFHYSTADILCDLLGIKNRNIFYRMSKYKMIRSVKTDVINKDLWLLTSVGLSLAREIAPEAARYSLDPNRIAMRLVRHNLSLQIYIIKNAHNITKITPEKCLHLPNISKLPDALIVQNGSIVAVEIERHHKSDARVYMGLYEHALAIGKYQYYDVVNYVFPTDALKNKYLRLFNCPTWPLYEYNEARKRFVEKPLPWEIPKNIGLKFNFITTEMM